MAGGLAALLDDIALIAKKAAAATDDVAAAAGRTSAKAAGVVVDDAAVAPKFVDRVTPARELPIVFRIGKGSLINKLLVILPLALLLSWLAPWALTPLLMVGGLYLSFEGAEKVAEKFGVIPEHHDAQSLATEPESEDDIVKKAVLTDFILSAEIMVISLNEVAREPFLTRTAVLIIVAILITAAVYGLVGFLVKIDDIGLNLMTRRGSSVRKFGKFLVAAMPKLLATIAVIGTFAMLWVGGHILLSGLDELGWHWPHEVVDHAELAVESAGGFVVWLVNTACSLIFGLVAGTIIVGVVSVARLLRGPSSR